MEIVTLDTPSLGDRSYVVHDGRAAASIDPQRDIDRLLAVLQEHDLQLHAIFETHVHNDYVSGGLELARRTGATYHLNAKEALDFSFAPLVEGEAVTVGSFTIRSIATPGHTPTHLSYVVNDGATDCAVFTGGSLLFGSVGRTDLIGPDVTQQLTRAQYRSAHRLVAELDDDVEVLPTHGFGSFCSSGQTSGDEASTIGAQRRTNEALTARDEDTFVRSLIAELDDHPSYYVHMGPLNRGGPADIDLSFPARVDSPDLLRRIHRGEWVVDLRNRRTFARDHITGTINIELADAASTYLGWTIPWGTPVTLIAESQEEIAQMQRQLVRIGIDRPAGAVPDGVAQLDAPRDAYEVSDFEGLRAAVADGRPLVVLDARRAREWEDGHLPMATHVPLHHLEQHLPELPAGEVWVHCATGYRASIAASLVARTGRRVTLIDDNFTESAPRHFELSPRRPGA